MHSRTQIEPVPPGYHSINENEQARILDQDGLLIHAEVRIGDSVVMIFDSREDWPQTPSFLQVYVQDAEATLSRALESGGGHVLPLPHSGLMALSGTRRRMSGGRGTGRSRRR